MIRRPTNDAEYFHERAIEEQVAAQRATCAVARERHDQMAAMYRFKESLLKIYRPLSGREAPKRGPVRHRRLAPARG